MASPSLTLHLAPGACSLAPHIILHHLISVPFDTAVMSVKGGIPAEFSKVNPKMRVPVLVASSDDGGKEVITEAPAILTYLAQLKPELYLLGKTDLERVRCYEWLNYLSGYVHAVPFGQLFRPNRFTDDAAGAVRGVRQKGLANLEDAFAYIESRMEGREWAVGEGLTVVDVFLFVFWRWGVEVGIDMGKFESWKRVMGRLVDLEGVKRALRAEGIESNFPGTKAKV